MQFAAGEAHVEGARPQQGNHQITIHTARYQTQPVQTQQNYPTSQVCSLSLSKVICLKLDRRLFDGVILVLIQATLLVFQQAENICHCIVIFIVFKVFFSLKQFKVSRK